VLADVRNLRQVQELVASAICDFGKLDYAFNNAGIEGGASTTEQIDQQQWDEIIGVNLGGVWLCMKYELQEMVKNQRGVIVNNASVAGVRGFANAAAYVASKHGVVGLTRAAALEHARTGIRINALCPGIVRTPMVERVIGGDEERESFYRSLEPIGRLGEPQEIVQAVQWLFSDEASFVTGHALVVDGGMCAG
jgi:NAD(P)-dependent dehydrogenase (short-subunit alcohol dehydrogenase family)